MSGRLTRRLTDTEGFFELYEKIVQLKLPSSDGKMRETEPLSTSCHPDENRDPVGSRVHAIRSCGADLKKCNNFHESITYPSLVALRDPWIPAFAGMTVYFP